MAEQNTPLFAARLNAFKIGAAQYWPGKNTLTTADLLGRAATAGLTAADLNYPDHFVNDTPAELFTGFAGQRHGPERHGHAVLHGPGV